MGFLRHLSTVVVPPKFRADSANGSNYTSAFFSGADMPDNWTSSLSNAGVNVTPDLAMTLAAMYCGVTTIAYDLATLPVETSKYREDGGKDPIRGRAADIPQGGIRELAYMLRWAPNSYQTATEYFASQVVQFLLRGRAYAEIISGPGGFLDQLLPRHPDRVFPQRLPSGRLTYKLIEANGQPRYVTQEEMHVVRDLSGDGISGLNRTQYGANVLGGALAAERAAGKFFKSGMAPALVATYKGAHMEDEDEAALHRSITRHAAGVENNFGLLLIPDDVSVQNLSIEPEKAQMMLAREWGAREVARLLRIPPHKLMIAGTQTYASQVQSATDYVVGCLRPTAHTFEQAMQRDLILAKDTYFVAFKLAELLRGDPASRADYYAKAIEHRWMRPSEVRIEEGLNPDEALDALSERDNQPGQSKQPPQQQPQNRQPATQDARVHLKGLLAVHSDAVQCVRREREQVEKLAKKYAKPSDGAAWQAGLRDFFADHAQFVAERMRVPIRIARGYAGQRGSLLEAKGVVLYEGEHWERSEADELAVLALSEGGSLQEAA